MPLRSLIALAAFATLGSPLPAQADVVWLLNEHSGVRITLQWTDIYGIRQNVTDSRSATLEGGGSDRLHAEAAIVPAPGDDKTAASYGIDYIRSADAIEALVNGAVVDEYDPVKIRLLHREEVGYRVDFRVGGPSVRIRFRQFSSGMNGSVSYVLYNRTKGQVISFVTDHRVDADFGTFALVDGDMYVLIALIHSKGSQGVEYGFSASFESDAPVQIIPIS